MKKKMNTYLAVLDNNENNGKTDFLPIQATNLEEAIGKARFYNSDKKYLVKKGD